MMTRAELLEMIRNGENSGVEFKRDTIDNRSMAKEIVAFANLAGGYLLLGIDDDGSIVGVTRNNLEEWVMNACRHKIRPELIPYFEIIKDVEPDKDIALVHVDRGWSVHHLWHNNHRTYYIRVGSQSREASPEELERIFQQRGAFRLEIRAVSGTSIEDLDLRRLEDYFTRVRQQEIPEDDDIQGWERLLINTDFMTEQNHNKAVTVAGLLLFGKTPYRFLPQASIDAAAYPGKEKDYTAKTRTALLGPLTPLFSSKGMMESGLVEEAMDFVRRNIDVKTYLEDDVRRKDRWDYPLEAVREGVVNALVHRDYLLSGTNIELSIYEDRLEIISPGRLPNGITPERMRTGCRTARNQLLKDVMRDYGYLEHMGMGIPRKIIKGMLEHNGTLPDLVEDGEQFILKLRKK
ncbi:MAG: ATP-binding protein [Candidatus Aminicenantes bacterium]|jgi:ATP-dependent DNA helicase RecG